MNILLYGQKAFGLEVMKRLHADGHKLVGVVIAPQRGTKKDKMYGYATMKGFKVFGDMENIRAEDIPDKGVDLIVSAHSHWIISQAALAKARFGGIGFHPSLLPRHRGQDAVRWTIHMRDPFYGGTIYRLTDKCDGGEVLTQRWGFVEPSWDYHALWERIFPIGVDMVAEAVKLIGAGKDAGLWRKQNEKVATWEPSWERARLRRNDLLMIG